MLRYEQIIKEYLEDNNVKLLGIEQDNRRILVEVEKEQNIVITDYIFRDKKAGWGSNFCYSYYNNGDKNKIKIKRFPKEGASHEIHYLRGDI